MFKNLKSKILGGLVGFVAVAGTALAVNTFVAGYNPATNQRGENGVSVAGGAVPSTAGSSCGTIGAVAGGTQAGTITTAAVTTCTIVLTLPTNSIVVSGGAPGVAAPNGLVCTLQDVTHPAVYALYSSAPTTTSCSFAAQTITAGDVLQYTINGY